MDELDLGATVRGFSPGQKVFGRYTLKKILGRGGMGVVWLAADEKLEREVALKFLPEIVKCDRVAMEELKRETRRALDLTHSNIVRIHDFVEDAAMAGIAMEYVPGDTLSHRRLDQPARVFEPEAIARWVRQLCEAITYAHEKGRVVHRDIKPANLMLDAHEDLKVADFGIARSISDSVSRISAQAGSSGTPAYMSPQQMMGERATPSDDVYAIGATLYELLTGKPPFHSGNLIAQVQAKVPPGIAERRAELGVEAGPIPPVWEEVIAACLAKEPEARPASAREIIQRLELRSGVSTAPFAPRPVSRPPVATATTPVPSPAAIATPPRRRGPVALASIVGVALLALAGWYFGLKRPEQEAQARREQELLATQTRQVQEQESARRAEREGTEWRERLATGTVLPATIEALAKEQTPRGQAARDYLATRQRDQETAEQTRWREITAQIDRILVTGPRHELDEVDGRVRTYLATAPERYRGDVEAAWQRRRSAWQAHEAANRPGTLAVETNPAGATVILYPGNERRTSPAVFRDVKPGDVTLRVEKEGYEAVDVPFKIEPGAENRPPTVQLASLFGRIAAVSDPPGVAVVVEASGRRLEGVTPFNAPDLAPGMYRVSFQRPGWQPQVKTVTVERGQEATVQAELRGATLNIRTTPPGALIMLDGREVGRSPLQLADLEPRNHRLDASAEGHDAATQTINLAGTITWQPELRERPAYRMLKLLAGHTWRLAKPWGWAEFTFDAEGKISGSHKIPLAGIMQDSGTIIKVADDARSLTANFVPSAPYPFYTGEVTMTLLDDYTLELTWMYSGKLQRYPYVRAGAPASATKRK